MRLPSKAEHVVLVSVDGLGPDFYLDPESHGAELPTLRALMRDGVYAEAVEGIYPTVTSLGYHGYLASHPRMKTGFLMAGPRVRSGVGVPHMRQIDIAPTIAYWAGWELGEVDGLVLRGLFEATPSEGSAC